MTTRPGPTGSPAGTAPSGDTGAATYRRLLSLRAVRDYLPEPVPDDAVRRILEAGRWTGSSKNTQRWGLILVTTADRREALAAAGRFTEPVRAAPAVLCLVREPDGTDFDIGRLAQNIMQAAAALGVASCPVTLHDEAETRRVLGLPAGRECRYAIALGRPDLAAHRQRRRRGRPGVVPGRKPLDDIVHREHYGG